MSTDLKPEIEPDSYWHPGSARQPDAKEDSYSVHEVRVGGRPVVREIVETILLTLLIFLGVRVVIQNFMVEGNSMEPSLHNAQYLLVNKAAYYQWDTHFLARLNPFQEGTPPTPELGFLLGPPQRGDIVVFHAPNDTRDFIKRVIALPGETVDVRSDDGVYVNGQKLAEPYIQAIPNYDWPSPGANDVVPTGRIFVLGDNRRNSDDSHVFGPIPIDTVVGRAWFSYLPLGQIGFLPHPTYTAPVPGTP